MLNRLMNGTYSPVDTIPTIARKVTGRYLAHHHLPPVEAAFLALDINSGAVKPYDFTMRQAAWLAKSDETYAHWAAKRQAERTEIVNGLIPLVPPRQPRRIITTAMLAKPITAPQPLTDQELIEVIATAGVERVLDIAAAVEATR